MRQDEEETAPAIDYGIGPNDDEIPDFSDKGCAWLWTWCIGPIIKLGLWIFQNYMGK